MEAKTLPQSINEEDNVQLINEKPDKNRTEGVVQ
jgi:hypothetical protein